jgi:2-phospho-L-lactate guanylyltransferase
MPSAWALLPVKPFAQAKTRLEPLLSRDECARLATEMCRDVLRALGAASDIVGIAVYGNEPAFATGSLRPGSVPLCLFPEYGGEDYRAGLHRVAAELEAGFARHLLVVPGDLPLLSSADVQALLAGHADGISVCAAPDGGTNALLMSPPTTLRPLYGPASAAAHLAAAQAAGITGRAMELPGFARDIDTPDDLHWLLSQRVACATLAWLKASDVADRLQPPRRK